MAQNNEKYILQSVDNALRILNLFGTKPSLSLQQISDLLGLNRSTVFRTVATLAYHGYLVKRDNGQYILGLRLLVLGNSAFFRSNLVRVFRPHMYNLAAVLQESVQLVVWADDYHVILIDKTFPYATMQADTYLGLAKYPHTSSTGLALLAQKTDAELDDYIEHVTFTEITEHTITTPDALRQAVEEIRRDKYAVNDQMSEIGLMSIAVPVLDQAGQPVAAISVSGPRERILEKKMSIVFRLRATANDVKDLL